jgi:prophage regulatory protein
MRKTAFIRNETSLTRLIGEISTAIECDRDWDKLIVLLQQLETLVSADGGPADLEHLRRQLKAALRAENFSEQVLEKRQTGEPRDRLLRLPDVIERVGLKKSAIYDKIRRNEFPKPVAISKRARAWHASKVARWIAERGRGDEEA